MPSFPRTIESARRENRNAPYSYREPVIAREPRDLEWLMPIIPPAGLAFGMFIAALFLS